MKRPIMALLALGLATGALLSLPRTLRHADTTLSRHPSPPSPVLPPPSGVPPSLPPPPPARGLPIVVSFTAPVRSTAAEELAAAGARVLGAPGGFALLAEIPPSALPAVRALPDVADIAEYAPERRIDPRLRESAAAEPQRVAKVLFQTFVPEDAPDLARRLLVMGAAEAESVPSRSRHGLVAARLPLGLAVQMAASAAIVSWAEEAPREHLCNDLARAPGNMAAEEPQSQGLDGTGEIIAMADTGLDSGDPENLHPDLDGQLLAASAWARDDDWSDMSGHGTHVAGSLAGTGAASDGLYRGMAPAARLVVQSVADEKGALHIPDDFATLLDEAYLLGARIHNNSWGSDSAGAYNLRAQQADEYVWTHPDMLLVASAGNDGRDDDCDGRTDPGSLASPASAKNVLTVAAAESGRAPGSGGRTSKTYGEQWPTRFMANPISSDLISTPPDGAPPGLAAFSSRGPADDGRTKPDVAAPGTDIASLRSRAASSTGWGVVPGTTNYIYLGGTSMAAPLASGAAAQIRQWARLRHGIESPSAALLKAAMAGGARSLAPGQYGGGDTPEIPPRPSATEGHGLVDVAATILPGDGAVAVMHEGLSPLATGDEAAYAFDVPTPGLPITAALAWSDAPALPGSSPTLVNDLDLRLVAPDGTVHMPAGAPNRIDNIERIDIPASVAVTGRWTAVVSAWNIPDGPQPYALYLRGAIHTPPAIDHPPLQNQSATATAYRVAATITADGAWDTSTATLHWRIDGGPWQTLPLAPSAPALPALPPTAYTADIPAAPLGSTIDYRLTADTVYAPGNDTFWTFLVAPDLTLTISAEGAPADASPTPPYGTHCYPSGTVLRATSPAIIPDPDFPATHRTACIGWTATGAPPPTGNGPDVTFTLTAPSTLTWRWQSQVALTETTDPADLAPPRTNWWPLGATNAAAAAPAAPFIADCAFADWCLDDARWPDATTPASPDAPTGIPMDAPHDLSARYLPATLDTDADGLPDWFTARYFPTGSPDASPSADPDADGWENAAEAADRTDPLDPASVPVPPAIAHVPVASPCTAPFPLLIAATITDNTAVASATLRIRRNNQPPRTIPMFPDPADPPRWTATTPVAATDGDTFAYSIAATDPAGLTAETQEAIFTVRWPGLSASPRAGFHFDLSTLGAPADAIATATLTLANTGSIPLHATLAFAHVGFADDAESGTNGWSTLSATTNVSTWHLGTAGARSPAHAWCNGLPDALPVYPCNADDSLLTPPIRLWPADAPRGGAPRLDFWHWADFERDYDTDPDTPVIRMWDTGILEYTTDSGTTWHPLAPDGGYPAIQSETASFFPEGTPCFAPTDDDWQPVAADLSPFAPDAPSASVPAQIRFRFASDIYVVHQGWRIDDLKITPRTQLPDTAPPGTTNWATLSADTLEIPPGATASITVRADAASLAPMQTDYLLLDLRHDDPRLPTPLPIPVSITRTDRRLTVTSEGPGIATPLGTALYPAPGPTNLLLTLTPDDVAILADLQLNATTLPDLLGTSAPTTLPLSLSTNLTIHAAFAIPPSPDQIPSADWLASWGLTNRPPVAEASLDPDRDGLLTWQEAALRSDPTDPSSAPLRLTLLPPSGTNTSYRLVWHAYTNPAATYTLQTATNPLSPYLPLQTLPASPPIMTSPPLPPAPAFHSLLYRP